MSAFDVIFDAKIGVKPIEPTGTELYAKINPLAKRKTLQVFNNTEIIVNVSNDPLFAFGEGIPIYPRQFITLSLNPDRYDAWYGKTESEIAGNITIVEVN